MPAGRRGGILGANVQRGQGDKIKVYTSEAVTAGKILITNGVHSSGSYLQVALADANGAASLRRGRLLVCASSAPTSVLTPCATEWLVVSGSYSAANVPLFLSDTAGDVSETAGTNPIVVGHSLSTTKALLQPNANLYRSAVYAITKRVQHSDLTAAAGSETLNFTSTIPAGDIVIGASFNVATLFSGGGSTVATLDVGFSGDADAWVDGEDVFGGGTGIRRQFAFECLGFKGKGVDSQATAITPTVTVSSDVNVVDLSAGDLTVTIYAARLLG